MSAALTSLQRRRDLGEVTQAKGLQGRGVYRSLEELLREAKPDVVFHTAVSKFKEAFGQIEPMARRGISVVSSCEELLFPHLREPKLAARLDGICRRAGARVIGTGVNPGFVMDVLPAICTQAVHTVDQIRVERVVDASTRRPPLQRKKPRIVPER